MPEAPPDLTGQTLGDFHVLRRLGAGGMGQVYLARQLSLKRDVALKLLNPELAEDKTALQRFQAEAEAVARISHPNIVQVYAIGEHSGTRYMALEYVDGRNLREFIAKKGSPDLPLAVSILEQVCRALDRASELGIVHRDIKPDNILVTRRDEVKVADFGLSRLVSSDSQPLHLTQTGITVGTPLYMAPEQVRGQPTDARTDLYALGATAYHLLAGEPPFVGATAYEVANKHANEPPPSLAKTRPDLPRGLCAVVHKLLAKAPGDRYPAARDVLRDLARVRDNLPVSAELPAVSGTVYIPPAGPGGGRWLIRAGVAAAGFVGGWLAFDRADRTPPSTAPAVPGLPEARLPTGVDLKAGRERALTAKLNDRQASLADVIQWRTELGLLQLRERRFPAALDTFAGLEKEKAEGRPGRTPLAGPPFPAHLAAAHFGRGVVLAFQDQADEAVKAFEDGLRQIPRGPAGEKHFEEFLFRYPELSLASAEALDRAAEEKRLTKFADPRLDRLRTLRPGGPAGKPR